ncbi:MAG: hypothetical protein HZB65_02500 [Candidatus Aenigmarchaeota archaeon]|nr:hypothetical protein [Candidatus Aenigmarchaeota archaeon]
MKHLQQQEEEAVNGCKAAEYFGNYVRDVSKAILAKDQEMFNDADNARKEHQRIIKNRTVRARDSFFSAAKQIDVYPIVSYEVQVFQDGNKYNFLMDECVGEKAYLLFTATNPGDIKSAAAILNGNSLVGTREQIIRYIDMLKFTQPKQIIIRDEEFKILYETEIDSDFLQKVYHSKEHVVKKEGTGFVVEHI